MASPKAEYAGYFAVPTLRNWIAGLILCAEGTVKPLHGDPHVPLPDIMGRKHFPVVLVQLCDCVFIHVAELLLVLQAGQSGLQED